MSVKRYSVGRRGVTILVPHPQQQRWHAVRKDRERYRTPSAMDLGKDSTYAGLIVLIFTGQPL
jgi:hypothetical protein